ncbi:MAG: hypothetical protein C4297_13250 [Gemmataceae bacterium]
MAIHLAVFRVDLTPPVGHPLCGGWIRRAVAFSEPLYALGAVLLGDEPPVVLCAVDWVGICNDAHKHWCQALAHAAHSTPERIALHTVHQHNAPFVDVTAQREIEKHKDLPALMDIAWYEQAVERTAAALREALKTTQRITHYAFGRARVERVASNRRVVGADGKIRYWRASSCRDPAARAEPEGTIDPWLASITFWSQDTPALTVHYYATHPMSYYRDGIVTSDFPGIARDALAKQTGHPHIYFTGCAGNVAAGKYNDGDRANRFLLAQRMFQAMEKAWRAERTELKSFSWKTLPMPLPPREDADEHDLRAIIADAKRPVSVRNYTAIKLSYRLRALQQPLSASLLRLDPGAGILHLPGECFVEYQLYAQEVARGKSLAVAAYGDDGPWYIPLERSFAEGGYEPGVAFASQKSETIVRDTIRRLLTSR